MIDINDLWKRVRALEADKVDITDWTDFTPTFGASHGTATGGTIYYAKYKTISEDITHCIVKANKTFSAAHSYFTMSLPVDIDSSFPTGAAPMGFGLHDSPFQDCYCLTLPAGGIYANRYDGQTSPLPFGSGALPCNVNMKYHSEAA